MAKKLEKSESCSCENCGCNSWGKVLGISLSALGLIIGIVTCLLAWGALICAQKAYETSKASYDFNVLSAGWEENFNRMSKVYASQGYVDYMSQYAQQGEEQFGLTEDSAEPAQPTDNAYASLDSLRDIAVNHGTDKAALQSCIEESRYTDAVNNMMNQGNQLFGVNGTPGNVIVDRENGNYILVSGAYPVEEFVNAINEYKNGAENYVAGGDEVKNVVEDMLANVPVRGDENARFTIVEYTELLCPFCQRHSQQWTINAVMEQFPWEVNSVSRHFIIHWDEALQLASAMECVAELNPSAYYETFEEAFKGL